jgi:hypothetical protein
MAAVRRALDSAYMRMTVCFMQQELNSRLAAGETSGDQISGVLNDVEGLLGKLR